MNLGLALKAEAVLAFLLISRHRAPRFALGVATVVVALVALTTQSAGSLEVRRRALVQVAGVLAAMATSRVLARGSALSAARQSGSPPWLAPTGRLVGVLAFIIPPVVAANILILGAIDGVSESILTTAAMVLYAAATAAPLMALTPYVGASAVLVIGCGAAIVGGIPPGDVGAMDPVLAAVTRVLWNGLPLPWRLVEWVQAGQVRHLLLFAGWTAGGIGFAALAVETREPHTAREVS